jgi:hypothetical protein
MPGWMQACFHACLAAWIHASHFVDARCMITCLHDCLHVKQHVQVTSTEMTPCLKCCMFSSLHMNDLLSLTLCFKNNINTCGEVWHGCYSNKTHKSNAKCRHLKKLTCTMGLCGRWLFLWGSEPHTSPLPLICCICVRVESERKGERQQFTKLGRKDLHDWLYL